MIAHYTNGNVLEVKKMLRHKCVLSSMEYIHMLNFKEEEFDVATATSVEEIKQLASAGFQKFDEFNSIHIFGRPKRFKGKRLQCRRLGLILKPNNHTENRHLFKR